MTASDSIRPADMFAIFDVFQQEAPHYAAPIYWGIDRDDPNSVVSNGTCFAINIGGKIIGVTAAHVLFPSSHDLLDDLSYTTQRIKNASVHLMIGNQDLGDLDARMIDFDIGLDIATFRLTSAEIDVIGIRTYMCEPSRWPPKPPERGKGLVFTGFPAEKRNINSKGELEFVGVTDLLYAADVGTDHIEIRVERNDLILRAGSEMPPIDRNLGGYSGAPVWTVSASPHELWRPGGIISKMPRNMFSDESGEEVAYIIARRLDRIKADGQIFRSYT